MRFSLFIHFVGLNTEKKPVNRTIKLKALFKFIFKNQKRRKLELCMCLCICMYDQTWHEIEMKIFPKKKSFIRPNNGAMHSNR